jgi:acetyl/propionyl-CoA carboxylase alpha subunit
VIDAGITFIGPSPKPSKLDGRQDHGARDGAQARRAPGARLAEKGLRDEELAAVAQEIGFPIMIKAAAGGGGKGMRAVLRRRGCSGRPRRGAPRGDGCLWQRRSLPGKADRQRRATSRSRFWPTATATSSSLGERECSIQRRHQKLIEEAPSVAVDEKLRAEMGEGGGGGGGRRSATSTPAPSNSSSTARTTTTSWR